VATVLLMLFCLGLGAAAGVAVHRMWRSRSPGPDQAAFDRRLAELERKYGPQGSVPGPGRPAPAAPPRPADRSGELRVNLAERHRGEYRALCAEARAACGVGEEAWKPAQEILDRHFAPAEAALAAFLRSNLWQPPDLRRAVAPGVAGTLEALRAALGEEAWKKLDAWRVPAAKSPEVWRQPRCTYFLLPEEYRAVTDAATGALRWNMAEPALRRLSADLGLPREQEEELQAVLRDHLVRYSAAAGGPGDGPRPAGADARIREAQQLTEEKLGKLLGPEKLKVYAAWKDALAAPARDYFNPPAPAGSLKR
jgi:hypothetical protein